MFVNDPAAVPRARSQRLLLESLPGELLIYDQESHRAHCLNATAAMIWRACDGTRDVDALSRLLHDETGLPEDAALVQLTVADLDRAGLLERPGGAVPRPTVGRREIIRRWGLTGALLALVPALQSVPAAAQSSLGSCIESGKCIPMVTECNPCHNGNKSQCDSKVCRGGNCVNKSASECEDEAPGRVNAARSHRATPFRR